MKTRLPPYIDELINAGITVTIHTALNGFYLDLNLMAKSHLHLTPTDDPEVWVAHMRYDEQYIIHNFRELAAAAKHGMHGRSFIDSNWDDLIQSFGTDI